MYFSNTNLKIWETGWRNIAFEQSSNFFFPSEKYYNMNRSVLLLENRALRNKHNQCVSLFLGNLSIYVFDEKQVRNTGSWMEIGNSISHFGIVSAQVVFVLLLFALTNTYTKDIQIGSAGSSSQKAA